MTILDNTMIDGMVILDRKIDLLTPMCTQYNYQGQLDESFGISFNRISVDRTLVDFEDDPPANPNTKKEPTKNMYITPSDEVFEMVKDYALPEVRETLSNKLRVFKENASNLSKTKDQQLLSKLAKEKKYMKKYKEHFSLAMHIESSLQKPFKMRLLQLEQVYYG